MKLFFTASMVCALCSTMVPPQSMQYTRPEKIFCSAKFALRRLCFLTSRTISHVCLSTRASCVFSKRSCSDSGRSMRFLFLKDISKWKQEYADLKEQRDTDYTKLKATRAEVAELQKIRKCVDIALKAEQPEQTQNRTKRHEQER